MTIIDILKEKLLGKKILVYEFDFKSDEKTPTHKRYYLDKLIFKDDKRMTYIGECYKTVVDISGYSYSYEGDSVYIYINTEQMNQAQAIGTTILDDIKIKE
jgi:hypothetical protein